MEPRRTTCAKSGGPCPGAPTGAPCATMKSAHKLAILLGSLGLVSTTACGGSVQGSPGDGGQNSDDGAIDGASNSDGSAGDGGTPWGVPPDGGPWSPICPEMPPTLGTACSLAAESAWCEYGDAWWDLSCDTLVQCVAGQWTVVQTLSPCFPQPGPNSSECPATPGAVQGPCADAGLTCYYGMGLFEGCRATCHAGPMWTEGPQGGCPDARPRFGSACEAPGLVCNYGDPSGLLLECVQDVWQADIGGGC